VCALAVVTLVVSLSVLAIARKLVGPSAWELPSK